MLEKEFITIIKDIARSREFLATKHHRHHINGTVYKHSLKVAYLCYLHAKRFGSKTDLCELVRGALLHDYYLYRLHGGEHHKFHWIRHPKIALANAMQKYPTLTRTQQDMIRHHMFPLTPIPPHTRAGWLVCFYDKVAAIDDRFPKNAKRSRITSWKHFAKKSKTPAV